MNHTHNHSLLTWRWCSAHMALFAALFMLPLTTAARAQPIASGPGWQSYWVRHDFNLKTGGTAVPCVEVHYFAHAWTTEANPACADSQVVPAGQPPTFDNFGRNRLSKKGQSRHRGVGGSGTVTANNATVGITDCTGMVPSGKASVPAPWPNPPSTLNPNDVFAKWGGAANGAHASCPAGSRASALYFYSVDPVGAGGPVTGTIIAAGAARAVRPPDSPRRASAYAYSMVMVEARAGFVMRNGTIRWNSRVVRDMVGGVAGAGRAARRRVQVDPIDWVIYDGDGNILNEGTLFDMFVDINPDWDEPDGFFGPRGTGDLWWENDVVNVTARNVDMLIEFPSTHTSLQGKLHLRVRNGIVEISEATGHFANVALPAPGESVDLVNPASFALENEFEFDYALPDDGDDDEVEIEIDFYGGGMAEMDDEGGTPADLTNSGFVGVQDLLTLLSAWGPCAERYNCPADLTDNGHVGVPDLLALLAQWGPGPHQNTPSGACCFFGEECGQMSEATCLELKGEWAGGGVPCEDVLCDPGIDPYTCVDSCGGFAPGGCSCMPECAFLGDCCEDACETCACLGSCCLGGVECAEMISAADCAAIEGEYLGDGASCDACFTTDPCPWDLNGDGVVDLDDLFLFLSMLGPCKDCTNCPADFNGDCVVDAKDQAILMANFGPCPG